MITCSLHYDTLTKTCSRMTTATMFSHQYNDPGSCASTTYYWENLILVVVLVLESNSIHQLWSHLVKKTIRRRECTLNSPFPSAWSSKVYTRGCVANKKGWKRMRSGIKTKYLKNGKKKHLLRQFTSWNYKLQHLCTLMVSNFRAPLPVSW